MLRFKNHISVVQDLQENKILIISLNNMYKIPLIHWDFITKLSEGTVSLEDKNNNIDLYNFFKENNMLIPNQKYEDSFYTNNLFYYERYNNNPVQLNEMFKNYTIGIIGCGGVGNVILDQIVALNIKNIVIIDYDIVSPSNLNRQFIFQKTQIGKRKVDIIKKYLLKKNTDLNIVGHNIKIASIKDLELLHNVDIIINAADTPYNLNEMIIEFCQNKRIDFITCGVGIDSGHIGPLLNFSSNKDLKIHSNSNNIKKHLQPMKASLGISNSIISSLMMNELFKYRATGECSCLNKIILFNFNNYETRYVTYTS